MAVTLTPLLCSTPGSPVSYNPGMAETFSWIPVSVSGGPSRPMFAQAVYLVNSAGGGGTPVVDLTYLEDNSDELITITNELTSLVLQTKEVVEDVVSLQLQQLGQNGIDFIEAGAPRTGFWTTVTVVSTARFSDIGAKLSNIGNLLNYKLPVTFTFSAPITSINLLEGAVIAYK